MFILELPGKMEDLRYDSVPELIHQSIDWIEVPTGWLNQLRFLKLWGLLLKVWQMADWRERIGWEDQKQIASSFPRSQKMSPCLCSNSDFHFSRQSSFLAEATELTAVLLVSTLGANSIHFSLITSVRPITMKKCIEDRYEYCYSFKFFCIFYLV